MSQVLYSIPRKYGPDKYRYRSTQVYKVYTVQYTLPFDVNAPEMFSVDKLLLSVKIRLYIFKLTHIFTSDVVQRFEPDRKILKNLAFSE